MKNIYTELEAKHKWCPFDHKGTAKCVGSGCMVWVWEIEKKGYCGMMNKKEIKIYNYCEEESEEMKTILV